MSSILISGGETVNEGRRFTGYVLVENGLIADVGEGEYPGEFHGQRIDASGKIVMPGAIDVHVHFREPGLAHKGDMASESAAALAGGVTSVLEMPNTVPAADTLDALERKFDLAEGRMATNYSFFLGAANDNLDEIKRIDPHSVCGVKLFMGSSTGNMLVDGDYALSAIFAESPVPISAHCEDEAMVRADSDRLRAAESDATARIHPLARTAEACYRSSARAVELADRYGARLHVAHLTTARELSLFDSRPAAAKRITAEACIPHLWFCDADYVRLGNRLKCNPAVKTAADREALRAALTSGKIDVVATDHAPHTAAEKGRGYWDAPSGIPSVQHSLTAMMELAARGEATVETVVEKMCHAPAVIFGIEGRGYLRRGYKADITIFDPRARWKASARNTLYKCGWSPFEGESFSGGVSAVIVNGRVAWADGGFTDFPAGERLIFGR